MSAAPQESAPPRESVARDPAAPAPSWPALPADLTAPVRAPRASAPGQPLPVHHDGCFACGGAHPDGLHLTAVAGEGVSVTTTTAIAAAHTGAPGLAHGGVVAAVLDETLGYVLWLMQLPAVTARLDVQFRRPVPVGVLLEGTGRCLGVAGRKVYTTAELRVGGELVAEATGLFVTVGAAHFTPYMGAEQAAQISRLAP